MKRGQALTDAIICPLSQTKVQLLLTGLGQVLIRVAGCLLPVISRVDQL